MEYKVFDFSQIDNFDFHQYKTFNSKGKKVLDVAMSFDIETSSFFIDKKTNSVISLQEYDKRLKENPKYENDVIKSSLCYIWQFAIDDFIFTGRTLKDFVIFTNKIKRLINGLNIIVYVHNLSYEFQFIRKYFKWVDVFAMDNRKVLFAKTDFITFKCSYLLSGKSLAKLCDDIHLTKIEKLQGDLDYKLLRTDKTPLTETELAYCYNDVLIVTAYIKEQILLYNRLDKIPLTNTGRVRRYTRKECFKNKAYASMIHRSLTLTPLEYKMARFAFQGGFTHANSLYTNITCKNVSSYDFTSSYPTAMLSEKYPMSKGTRRDNLPVEQFENYIKKYCCLFTVELWDIKTTKDLQPIISISKCLKKENARSDNGRLFSADYILTVLTDVDYNNLKTFYSYGRIKIGVAYFYKRDYLPKEILRCVLKFYSDKTTLKGVKGKEVEYLISKEMLNSLYGMTVYNPIKPQYTYLNDEWNCEDKDIDEKNVNEYNDDKTRFTYYLWGVFITAYARNNLFTGIKELKNDFIYCDTDSVKCFNADKHKKYFINYNNGIYQKLKKCCLHFGFSEDSLKPKNQQGKQKLIGIWDYEGVYNRFKTLGCKRYLVEKDGKLDLTVSGINKKLALPYLLDKYKSNDKVFENFNNKLFIPKEYTGKRIHTYIDDVQGGIITDYLGNVSQYETLSGIHLIECEYDLSIANDYLLFFESIQNCANFV